MVNTVSFNGKDYTIDKVLSLATQSAKDIYSVDKVQELSNLDKAVTSDKTEHLIITPFEGKTVVLIKPNNLEQQLKNGKVKIAFYSKFLIKKLNTENVIIDTSIVDNRPRFDRRDNYRNNDRSGGLDSRRNNYDDRADNRFNDNSSNRNRPPQKPRLFQSQDKRSSPNNRHQYDV